MTDEEQDFINRCKAIIKGLNDMSIKHPEEYKLFNKTTDMLEGKIKAIKDKYTSSNGNES